MIHAQLTGSRGKSIKVKIQNWKELDPTDVMAEGQRILYEENERRALAGLDVNEQAMPATLREKGIGGEWRTIKGHPVLIEQDPNPPAGPPLLPYDKASRMIRLAETRQEVRTNGVFKEYAAQLGWPDFTSSKGDWIPGFHSHPDGKARYPKRNMTDGISKTVSTLWRRAVKAWLQSVKAKS